MTDNPPNRLWPLALMGWLAAFPPVGREASAAPATVAPEPLTTTSIPAGGATGLREARAFYAPLTAAERAVIRRRRRNAP